MVQIRFSTKSALVNTPFASRISSPTAGEPVTGRTGIFDGSTAGAAALAGDNAVRKNHVKTVVPAIFFISAPMQSTSFFARCAGGSFVVAGYGGGDEQFVWHPVGAGGVSDVVETTVEESSRPRIQVVVLLE